MEPKQEVASFFLADSGTNGTTLEKKNMLMEKRKKGQKEQKESDRNRQTGVHSTKRAPVFSFLSAAGLKASTRRSFYVSHKADDLLKQPVYFFTELRPEFLGPIQLFLFYFSSLKRKLL